MAVLRWKNPGNYKSAPVHTSTPEPLDISGGVALLAEAPADPSTYPVTVTVNGQARTRVTSAPGVGQFRVMTQTVIGSDGQGHNEYLPLLQFSAADEGLSGSCDYWQNGTVLTSQFFDVLLSFLTPLVVADVSGLPQPTMAATLRGRPGDTAYFTGDGTSWWSDGSSWRQLTGNALAISGGLSLAQTLALALDSGYVGPSLSDSQSFDNVIAFSANATWQALNAWVGDLSLSSVLGLSMDAVAAHAGATTYAAGYGLTLDGVSAQVGATALAGTFALAPDASWAAAASDTGLPVVQSFTLGAPTGLVVPIAAFSATDGLAPTLYLLTESATPPSASSGNWQPASYWAGTGYTFGSAGAKTLWAWAKDGAGTVSSVYTSRSVTVSAGATGVYAQGAWPADGSNGYLVLRSTSGASDTGYALFVDSADDGEGTITKTWALYRNNVARAGFDGVWSGFAYVRLEADDSGGAVRVRSASSAAGPWTTVATYTDPTPLAGGSTLNVLGSPSSGMY